MRAKDRAPWTSRLAVLGLSGLVTLLPTAATGSPDRADRSEANRRILLFSKTAAFRHASIPDAVSAVKELGAENGFSVDATEDALVFVDDRLSSFDAVVFLLTSGDLLDSSQRAAFERYIRSGRGFVGVHSASDTEYGWAWYGGLVGAYFAGHPAIQHGVLTVTDRNHSSTRGLPVR